MKKETSSKQNPEKNQLKNAINTLKFFDHRVREQMKNKEKSVPAIPGVQKLP